MRHRSCQRDCIQCQLQTIIAAAARLNLPVDNRGRQPCRECHCVWNSSNTDAADTKLEWPLGDDICCGLERGSNCDERIDAAQSVLDIRPCAVSIVLSEALAVSLLPEHDSAIANGVYRVDLVRGNGSSEVCIKPLLCVMKQAGQGDLCTSIDVSNQSFAERGVNNVAAPGPEVLKFGQNIRFAAQRVTRSRTRQLVLEEPAPLALQEHTRRGIGPDHRFWGLRFARRNSRYSAKAASSSREMFAKR